MEDPVVILAGARTPFCEYVSGKRGDGLPGGRLAEVSALDLGAIAARAALERSRVPAGEVDHVVMGNAMQTSADALYGARHVGLKAGCPQSTPALTVNRLCGSGLQAIVTGAQMLRLEEARTVLAGGMENMSQAPHVIRGLRRGLKMGPAQLEDSLLAALLDTQCGLMMAQTAERLATRFGVGRGEQDAYALQSQQRAAAARERGVFRAEITPVSIPDRKAGTIELSEDDHMKPDTTLEGLAALPPAFGREGTVTAGNASGIVDGAAAVVLQRASDARSQGRPILAEVRAWSVVGVDPAEMGIGPAPAIRLLLERTGLSLEAIDLFEVNEAFAAQVLPVARELRIDPARLNVNGGAIAIGHPLGATGTRLLLTLGLELERRRARFGIASACIGGGQGIAVLIENPNAGGSR